MLCVWIHAINIFVYVFFSVLPDTLLRFNISPLFDFTFKFYNAVVVEREERKSRKPR